MQGKRRRRAFAGFHRTSKEIKSEDFHFYVCEGRMIMWEVEGERWISRPFSKPNIFFADGGVNPGDPDKIRLAGRSDHVMNAPEPLTVF